MREILFRGKILEEDDVSQNGNWVYGYLVYAKSDFDDETQRVADIIPHDTDRVYKGEYNVVFPCDIKTMGQYTGLTDKNGKKIFEGDVIWGDDCTGTWHKGVVEYDDSICSFIINAKRFMQYPKNENHYDLLGCWSIEGNVHDNPELLESKQ